MAKDNKTLTIILIIAAFIIGAGGGFGLSFLLKGNTVTTANKSALINLYPDEAIEDEEKWLAKIGDYVIPVSDFDIGFQIIKEQYASMAAQQGVELPNDAELKLMYIDNLINTYVVTIYALDNGLLDKDDNRIIINYKLREIINQLYFQEALPEDQMAFTPSNVEIDQFYQQYKSEFNQLGMTSDQIKQYITQQLSQMKTQEWMQNLIGQVKEEYSVKRNSELINSMGIGNPLLGTSGLNLPDLTQP